MSRLGERKLRLGMKNPKTYKDYLREYTKKMAPIRAKKALEAKKAKKMRKAKGIDISISRGQINAWRIKPDN